MGNPFLGILALDTRFPRIIGDVGNPATYPFGAVVEVVSGADSIDIVRDAAPAELLTKAFIAKACELERRGAAAIVSTCGFLVHVQDMIAGAVNIPVMLSGLSLYPVVAATCPGRIGILTASRPALGHSSLAAAGIPSDEVAVAGLEDVPAFAKTFLAHRSLQATKFDRKVMEQAVVSKAIEMQRDNPTLSAILLECGNIPPYAGAIKRATGLPVFHLALAAPMLMGQA